MRLHEPLGPPYTKKSDFFNERILINGRRRLSKHAPRHLPPIFFFNRARFRRERADLVPFIWVLLGWLVLERVLFLGSKQQKDATIGLSANSVRYEVLGWA